MTIEVGKAVNEIAGSRTVENAELDAQMSPKGPSVAAEIAQQEKDQDTSLDNKQDKQDQNSKEPKDVPLPRVEEVEAEKKKAEELNLQSKDGQTTAIETPSTQQPHEAPRGHVDSGSGGEGGGGGGSTGGSSDEVQSTSLSSTQTQASPSTPPVQVVAPTGETVTKLPTSEKAPQQIPTHTSGGELEVKPPVITADPQSRTIERTEPPTDKNSDPRRTNENTVSDPPDLKKREPLVEKIPQAKDVPNAPVERGARQADPVVNNPNLTDPPTPKISTAKPGEPVAKNEQQSTPSSRVNEPAVTPQKAPTTTPHSSSEKAVENPRTVLTKENPSERTVVTPSARTESTKAAPPAAEPTTKAPVQEAKPPQNAPGKQETPTSTAGQRAEAPKAEAPKVEPLRPRNEPSATTQKAVGEVPQPKVIAKGEAQKATESTRSENAALLVKLKDLAQQVVSTNSKDIVRVQAKDDLVKVIENAVKKATFEGKTDDLIKVIKQTISEPAVKEAIKVITSSAGDGNAIKELKELLNQVVLIRNKEEPTQKPDVSTIPAKRVEDIQSAVVSKEAALQALVGILIDADKITSRLVKEVQIETVSKLSQIQSTVDELIKLRVEQFISLSVKGYGVDGATFKALCQETITELANRYGLTDQQRILLNQILIQISESDFQGKDVTAPKEKGKDQEQEKKDPVDPKLKELTPKEIEALFRKEVEVLEEFLKEREEIRRAKVEAELVNLLAELVDESMSYMIDENLEVIKVFTISGQVINQQTRRPVKGVRIYAGLLGEYETDETGAFIIRNVPEDTVYVIGADHPDYVFTPPYHNGTLEMSIQLVFEATSSDLN